MINGRGGTRADLGAGLFSWLLTVDPNGPRFAPRLVGGADRFEQEAGPAGDWPAPEWREFRLFAGETLIAERRLSRARGDAPRVEDTPL